MACFEWNLHTQISSGDYPCEHYFLWITHVSTTFCGLPMWAYFLWRLPMWTLLFVEITHVSTTSCGDYPCEHYFYVPWLIMTSQWVMTLQEMYIVMSQWVMVLLCVHIIMMLLQAYFIIYVCTHVLFFI